MKKIEIKKNMLTREKLSNPFSNLSINKRLIKSDAIDLENNFIINELDNGYFQIKPIDSSKKIK